VVNPFSPAVLQLAKAISVAEGFGVEGSIPTRANNPGDLTGADGGGFVTRGTANAEGVLIFLKLEDGWQALHVKVERMLAGKSAIYHLTDTLEDLARKYTGGDNPDAWAKNVATYLGVETSTTLQQIKDAAQPQGEK